MPRNPTSSQVWLAATLLCCATATSAQSTKPRLKMFGDQPNPHGLWKMELLESSNQQLMANARRMSEVAVCMGRPQEHELGGADRDQVSGSADHRDDDEAGI
jgi:hypothetical protein